MPRILLAVLCIVLISSVFAFIPVKQESRSELVKSIIADGTSLQTGTLASGLKWQATGYAASFCQVRPFRSTYHHPLLASCTTVAAAPPSSSYLSAIRFVHIRNTLCTECPLLMFRRWNFSTIPPKSSCQTPPRRVSALSSSTTIPQVCFIHPNHLSTLSDYCISYNRRRNQVALHLEIILSKLCNRKHHIFPHSTNVSYQSFILMQCTNPPPSL